MAWQTGPHAKAPQGVLCFPTDKPGEVTWDDEALANAEPPPPPPPPEYPDRDHGQSERERPERDHG